MNPVWREWILAVVTIAVTLIAMASVRTVLRRARADSPWAIFARMSGSIRFFIFIIGLRIFVNVAPLSAKFVLWIDDAIYALTVIVLLYLLRNAVLLAIDWSTGRAAASSSKALQAGFIPLLQNLLTLFVFFTGTIMIMKHFNYDVLSLLTALGVGSLAVGLAAKDTLANMISGFTIIIDRNLRPGDRINLGGAVGNIQEIGLRSTRIATLDGNVLVVPNSDLVNTKFVNLSDPTRHAIFSTTIRIPYTAPFAQVKAIGLEILSQIQKVDQTRGKWVNLANLSDGYQQIGIGCWMLDLDYTGDIATEFNEKLLARLNQAGIPLIPYTPIQTAFRD